MARSRLFGVAALTISVATTALVVVRTQTPSGSTVRGVEWAGKGVWLKSELHVHTRFSDGNQTVESVANAAVRNGCDALAITDHSDGDLKAATPEYFEAIGTARSSHANLLVLTGLEWNVPPGKGNEHAGVLCPSELERIDLLQQFKTRFDDLDKKGENPELAREALAWLNTANGTGLAPFVAVHHPTRVPDSTSAPLLTFEALRLAAPRVVRAVEGGPGHQKSTPLGSYKKPEMLINRWDPIVAEVGGAWDKWLSAGLDVWGASADADFHGPDGEFWPCEFSSTWIYAPDRSVDGIIRALHAGSYAGEQGHIVERPELRVQADDLPHPVIAGQRLTSRAGKRVTATLTFDVPSKDYAGNDNRIDVVELIGISAGKASVIYSGPPGTPDAFSVPVTVPPGGIVLRARGKRGADGPSALMFYTNPIRIEAR
jgi:hypothetical protein